MFAHRTAALGPRRAAGVAAASVDGVAGIDFGIVCWSKMEGV
jgi:hypothetical protein